MVVTFSGLDGSGKSTQIEALTQWLVKCGYKPVYLWARGGYSPGFKTIKQLMRWLMGRRFPRPGDSVDRDKSMQRPCVVRLWLLLSLIDLIVYWGIYLRLQNVLGRVVICDRYIDDTRLDFRRNFPSVAFEKMFFWRVLEWVTPQPDAAFLLWIPVDESMRRSREKGEPFPDDEETLEWRLQAYLDEDVFPSNRYIQLDCRQSMEAVSVQITDKIYALLKKEGRTGAT